MVQERTHRFQSAQDFTPDLIRGTHRIHGNQDSAVTVPCNNWGCHFMVKSKALGYDFPGVVGAMLERGSRELATREFRVVGLQVQHHIRRHPEFAAYEVGRASLLHVSRDPV